MNCGFRAPASRRPAVWRTSTGQRPSPWTVVYWTPSSPWSSWTSTNMCCWWDRRVSGRASWPRPWATPPSAPDTPCALSMPTASSKPCPRLGWTTRWTVPSGPSCLRTCSSWTTWDFTGSPQAVRGPVRTDPQPSPGIQLHNHQQPGRGRVAEHLRRPHPGKQRPGPTGQRQLPVNHRGLKLPGKTVPTPEVAGPGGGD